MAKRVKEMLNPRALRKLKEGEIAFFADCEDIDSIERDNYRVIDEKHVSLLYESARETGLQTEIILHASKSSDGSFILTVEDGHHRLEAVRRLRGDAEKSGKSWLYRPLPCRVELFPLESGLESVAKSASGAAVASVIRNQLHRVESIWDKADAYQRLKEAGESTTGIARMVGVDERSVRRTLSLQKLPAVIRDFAVSKSDEIKASSLYRLAATIEKALGGNALETELFRRAGGIHSKNVKTARDLVRPSLPEGAAANEQVMATFLALDYLPTPELKVDSADSGDPGTPKKPLTVSGSAKRLRTPRSDVGKFSGPKGRIELIVEQLAHKGMPVEWVEITRRILEDEGF